MDSITSDVNKIAFRDTNKNYRYLFPSDILYLKAAAQWSIVHTKTETFQVWGLLADYEKAFHILSGAFIKAIWSTAFTLTAFTGIRQF